MKIYIFSLRYVSLLEMLQVKLLQKLCMLLKQGQLVK